MASRIALYEAGASATFTEVDPVTKLTREGQVYREVYPLGLVPALRTESGELLTENAAVLQFLAARFPEAGLSPRDALGQARLQQWLCFIGTELHKTVFGPLLDRSAPEGARAYALEKAPSRFELLDRHLSGREFLLDAFSVADAYLFTVLGWSVVTPIELGKWSALAAYHERLAQRPSVARARAEEGKLYAEERARHRAA
jgi:glutathione S-transferase